MDSWTLIWIMIKISCESETATEKEQNKQKP